MIFSITILIGAIVQACLNCSPTSAFWSISARLEGKCWPQTTSVYISYGFGIYFVITDFIIAMLPLAFIQNIMLPLREKVILAGLMAAGLFAMGAGIAKIFLFKAATETEDFFYLLSLLGVAM
jgi:hypothetical protein